MQRSVYPNESAEYREARDALLDAEQTLRDQLERVAAQRRALPLGGEVKHDYAFEERTVDGASTTTRLSDLFAPDRDSLLVYSFMFGPKMQRACPMCTSFLDSLNGVALHLGQRMNVAVCARESLDRICEFGDSRGWNDLRLLSAANNSYPLDYLSEDQEQSQLPMANVFVRRAGKIHHFWGSELMFRPWQGGHTRHVDILWPLWNIFDLTPEGRGESWFPALEYE